MVFIASIASQDVDEETSPDNSNSTEGGRGNRRGTTTTGCPTGWTAKQISTGNTECYRVFKGPLTWFQAQHACMREGANLASIPTSSVNYFIYQLWKNSRVGGDLVFIGGYKPTDKASKYQWAWWDGTPFVYTNWKSGEPNNYKGFENCMSMRTTVTGHGQWNDYFCIKYTKPYICSKRAIFF